MAIVLVMITLIHSFIFGSGYTADASETVSTAAGSGELHSETAEGNAVITGSVTFTDESKLVEVQQIYLPFPDVTGQKTEWDFPYSDEFFSLPSDEFCITMARGSMGLTLSAFRSNTESMSSQYETYLKEAGRASALLEMVCDRALPDSHRRADSSHCDALLSPVCGRHGENC